MSGLLRKLLDRGVRFRFNFRFGGTDKNVEAMRRFTSRYGRKDFEMEIDRAKRRSYELDQKPGNETGGKKGVRWIGEVGNLEKQIDGDSGRIGPGD